MDAAVVVQDLAQIFESPFSLPAHWGSTNYRTAWTEERFGDYFLNTIAVVGSALVIVMLLGSMCAYVLARFQFPGNRLIYWMMLACLTFPIFLAIVPLFKLMQNFHLLNRQPGLVVVYVAFALPFTVFFLYPFFRRLPDEIAEAAAVDGAGEWRTFFQVMLPMAKPGIASVAIFNFLGLWNQFLPTGRPEQRPGQLRAGARDEPVRSPAPATPSTSARSSPP